MKANFDSFGIISLTSSDDVLSQDASRDEVTVCVCVCVCEREKERERESVRACMHRCVGGCVCVTEREREEEGCGEIGEEERQKGYLSYTMHWCCAVLQGCY